MAPTSNSSATTVRRIQGTRNRSIAARITTTTTNLINNDSAPSGTLRVRKMTAEVEKRLAAMSPEQREAFLSRTAKERVKRQLAKPIRVWVRMSAEEKRRRRNKKPVVEVEVLKEDEEEDFEESLNLSKYFVSLLLQRMNPQASLSSVRVSI